MKHAVLVAMLISVAAPAALAEPLPPGLKSARLLAGWTDADGNRISALELRLLPGWKTYWRQPGDSGLPPSFDWTGSRNLADVTFHWPAPEAIASGDEVTLGYHDRLVLPFTARPRDPARPVSLDAAIALGLCDNICVPAHLDLNAPQAGPAPDPQIAAALAQVPAAVPGRPACRIDPIRDGMRLDVLLPQAQAGTEVAAMELDGQPDIWVSATTLAMRPEGLRASADFVPPSGAPFDLDAEALRLTLIGPAGAVEMRGCAPQG